MDTTRHSDQLNIDNGVTISWVVLVLSLYHCIVL